MKDDINFTKVINNLTNMIVKPSEAQKRLSVGEKVFMPNPMGEGEDIVTIEGFKNNMVLIRGEKAVSVLGIPMTQEVDNLKPREIKIKNNQTGEEKTFIIKAPYFRKAPELNQ